MHEKFNRNPAQINKKPIKNYRDLIKFVGALLK